MNRALIASGAAVAIAFAAGWLAAGQDGAGGPEREVTDWHAPGVSLPEPPQTDWRAVFNAPPPPDTGAPQEEGPEPGRVLAMIERGEDAFLLIRARDGAPVRLRPGDAVGANGWRVLTLNPSSVEFEREGRVRAFSAYGAGRSALEDFLNGELSCPQGEECA